MKLWKVKEIQSDHTNKLENELNSLQKMGKKVEFVYPTIYAGQNWGVVIVYSEEDA